METFSDVVNLFIDLISLSIPIIFSLTLLVIVWKIVDAWILNAGDPTKIEEGKKTAIVGVIALVIMSSIWGILAMLQYSIFW